jgi:signal transduction histidine kinase
MFPYRFSGLVIILLILLSGCHDRRKMEGNDELNKNREILDSITKLDSLTLFYRVRNDSLSYKYAAIAVTIAKRMDIPEALVKAYNAMGNSFSTRHQDSSFYYYNLALKLANSNKLEAEKPNLLYNIAMVYLHAFNYKSAMMLLDSCINIASITRNFNVLSNANNSLGFIHEEIKDTGEAKKLFKKAFQTGTEHGLPKQIAAALCNLGAFEKDPRKVITLQKKAIQYLKKLPGTEEEMASVYNNIGSEETIPDSAIFYYQAALTYSKASNLPLIEISVYNNLAYSYLDKGEFQKAHECLVDIAIPLAKKINNNDWLSTLYDSYADVLAKKGDYNGAYAAVRKSIEIKSKIEYEKNEEQLRLLFAILDLKNKEITIKENESEIRSKNSQNEILKLSMLILFLLIVIILFLFVGFRQKTRIKLKQQQILSARRIIDLEETEKSRIGFELHDNIGYLVRGIDGFIKSLEIIDQKSKENLDDKFIELSESIRRISHRMNLVKDDQTTIQDLVSDIINDMKNLTGINVQYFIPDHLPAFSREIIVHVCRIIQELLTNAVKYARDSKIRIDLAYTGNKLILFYHDNGPGFNADTADHSGIGLKSITERITLLNGKSKLNSSIGKGTRWEITIPFSK